MPVWITVFLSVQHERPAVSHEIQLPPWEGDTLEGERLSVFPLPWWVHQARGDVVQKQRCPWDPAVGLCHGACEPR